MRAETETETETETAGELEAPPAPLAVEVPQLDHQAPEGAIAGLEGVQELGEPFQLYPPPEEPARPRLRRGRPPKGQELSNTPNAVRKRRQKEARQAKGFPAGGGKPATAELEPVTVEGIPLPAGTTPEDIDQLGHALALTFGLASSLAATQYGELWQLQEAESAKLGRVWAAVLAPHLGAMGAAAPWVTASLVTAGVLAPRVLVAMQGPRPAPELAPIAPPEPTPPAPLHPEGRAPAVVTVERVSPAPVGGYEIKPPKGKAKS